ncbi:MAG TPA: hypothetical protein VLW85_03810 [Myxococcales bacterium]|nr:hypothetical protein [Myxococcales bacterium]
MIWLAPAAAAALGWLWFLALGRARGEVKRLGLRATLLAIISGMVWFAQRRGLFARASIGFQVALLVTLLIMAVGYLYSIRFCAVCGRMVRNLKVKTCPRCGAALARHGMTNRLRREPAPPATGGARKGGAR